MARDYRSKMVRVRLLAALLAFIPLAASATIYQWTDEQGHVVLGNQVPETARNVRAVMKEDPAPPPTTNRELEERIARLERQLQAAQAAPAPYPVAPAPYPAAPTPMPADYYGAPYSPAMYPPPPYYPYGYGYAYPFAVVTVVRPVRRFAVSPHFVSRAFIASPPFIVSRPFISSPAFISFHHAAMHRR